MLSYSSKNALAGGQRPAMPFIQTLPVLEVLIINLISTDICLRRRYSRKRTILVLVAFSALVTISVMLLAPPSFQGDGTNMVFGFIYLPVLYLLYNTSPLVLFTFMSSCWSYSMGILSLSFLCSEIWFAGIFTVSLFIETLLFMVSILPFYRLIISKYIFVVNNHQYFERDWKKYIFLNNVLQFLTLLVMHNVLLAGDGSPMRVCLVLFLLASMFASNITLYDVILDLLRIRTLEKAVLIDPLTGLENRTGLQEQLNKFLDTENDFSVVFMDLDRFKSINDRYGHLAGDAYLRHFAELCLRTVEEHGKVYRYGGDEFVVLYDGDIPDSIISRLQACPDWGDDAPCTFQQVSIGTIHCMPPHTDSADTILKRADLIMYRQKLRKQR